MSEILPTGKLLLAENIIPSDDGGESTRVSTLTRQSVVAMMGGVLSQGLKFLVVIYIARRLSISEFGLISFAIAMSAYTLTLSNFGLPVFGCRAVARSGYVSQGLLGEVACLRSCLAITGIIVSVGILYLVPGMNRIELLLVGIFGLSNVASAGLFDWAFQGLHRQEISAALNIIWQGGWLALTILGMHLGMGILSVPTALVGAALVASGVGYFWLRQTGQIRPGHNDQANVLRRSWGILKLGAPLGWGTLTVTFLVWSDAIVVRLMRGGDAVGIYAAGNRAGLALAMLANFYVLGALPHLSQAGAGDRSRFAKFFQRTYKDLALMYLPGTAWTILYAPEIIQVLFKQHEYQAAVSVFRIFQVMLVVNVVSNLYGIGALVALHRDKAYRKALWVSALVFVPLCPILTIAWGIRGAAVAVLAVQILCLVLTLIEARDLIPSRHGEALFVPVLFGGCVVAACRSLSLPLGEGFLVLGATYMILLAGRIRSAHQKRISTAYLGEG